MKPLYSVSDTRWMDNHAIKHWKYPSLLLMENAAHSVLKEIKSFFKNYDSMSFVGIVCGKGNNAGDGFALARLLAIEGKAVVVYLLDNYEEFSRDARINYDLMYRLAIDIFIDIVDCSPQNNHTFKVMGVDLLIDAVLGTGFSGELKDPILYAVKECNEQKCAKVSIDVPTGLNADTGRGEHFFQADLVVSLGELKKGLFVNDSYNSKAKIAFGSIGLPKNVGKLTTNTYLLEMEDIKSLLPKRERDLNKYSAGKVLSIAGSQKYVGAGELCAYSALRVGAGASILMVPDSQRGFFVNNSDLVVNTYNDNGDGYLKPDSIKEVSEMVKWSDVTILGPGLNRNKTITEAVEALLNANVSSRFVIDADGLFAISQIGIDNLKLKNSVLTPHIGEFSLLSGLKTEEIKNNLFEVGTQFVKKYKCHLVLKGAPTVIFEWNKEGVKVFVNSLGNSGLAKFGSGDVLAGIIGGFIAQNKELKESLRLGVLIHSLTADLLSEKHSEYGFTATDLVDNIFLSFKEVLK